MNSLLSKNHITTESYKIYEDYYLWFLINKNVIVYIGKAKLNSITPAIWNHSYRYNIKYDSCFLLKCKFSEVNDLQTKYILKFNPKFNLGLPTNSIYSSKNSINKIWVDKYGYNYKHLIDISKIKSFKHIIVGQNIYYKIKDLQSIEPIFDSEYLSLSRKIKKSVYTAYFTFNMSVDEVVRDLCLDINIVCGIIDELKCRASHKNIEKDKILKMYFCNEYSIKDIAKNNYISENHIINVIIDYLSLFGI